MWLLKTLTFLNPLVLQCPSGGLPVSPDFYILFTFLLNLKRNNWGISLVRTWCVFRCLSCINTSLPPCSSVFRNPVCKVYRFQTVDSKWMLVREQMEECTLSFSIPKQLLSLYVQEDKSRWAAVEPVNVIATFYAEVIGLFKVGT